MNKSFSQTETRIIRITSHSVPESHHDPNALSMKIQAVITNQMDPIRVRVDLYPLKHLRQVYLLMLWVESLSGNDNYGDGYTDSKYEQTEYYHKPAHNRTSRNNYGSYQQHDSKNKTASVGSEFSNDYDNVRL